jgi:hypothetical protein
MLVVAVMAATTWCACKPTSGNLTQDVSYDVTQAECAEAPSGDAQADVCRQWACGHSGLSAAAWSGNAKTCSAGRVDGAAEDKTLRLINMYRALAGVPAVEPEPSWADPAQDCALLAQANGKLSHTPPQNWSCWSDRGARASGVSLIANRSAPLAIDPFIEDPGNETTMVHRRWLLSEAIHRIAIGSTSGFTCALVDGRQFETPDELAADATSASEASAALSVSSRTWVAWPPDGPVPIDVFRRTRTDAMGWTLQSSSLDLEGIDVEVRVAGALVPIKIEPLEKTLGSLTAVRFLPQGWSTEAGKRYDVHAVKGDLVIDFAVEPVDCQ